MDPSPADPGARTGGTRLARAGDFASRVGSLEPSDPQLRRGLHIGVGIALALGVGLAIAASVSELPSIDWRFRPAALALGVIGFAATLFLNAELWRRLLHALGPEIAPLRASAIWFVSGLGRFVPTSLLLPVVRTAMAEREGAPKRISLASVVYEMSLGLTAALVLGAYFIVDLPDLQGHWQRLAVLAVPVIAVIALQPAIFHRCADYGLTRLGRAPLPLSLPGWRIFEFLALYSVSFVVAGLSVYAFAQCVYPVDAGDIVTVTGAFAAATAVGLLAFVLPAGIGAREATLAVALSPVMPAGPAVAVAVLARIIQIVLEVLIAVVMQVFVRLRGA